MALNDQSIIDNTHFEVDDDDNLICYTVLPDGERFSQQVSSKEAVQKNMIGWCNTVREHVKLRDKQREEERIAAKKRRQAGYTASDEEISDPPIGDTRQVILAHYDALQERIDQLGDQIAARKAERDHLRNERDELKPIITVWRGE